MRLNIANLRSKLNAIVYNNQFILVDMFPEAFWNLLLSPTLLRHPWFSTARVATESRSPTQRLLLLTFTDPPREHALTTKRGHTPAWPWICSSMLALVTCVAFKRTSVGYLWKQSRHSLHLWISKYRIIIKANIVFVDSPVKEPLHQVSPLCAIRITFFTGR